MYQPGERWLYSIGAQLYGVLVERASGQALADFMTERIFEPLGMRDTGFSYRPDQRDRLTTAYNPDLTLLDAPGEGSYWMHPPAMPDASSWLVSTIDDFWSFVQMLVSGTQRSMGSTEPAGLGWDGGTGTTWRTDPACARNGVEH